MATTTTRTTKAATIARTITISHANACGRCEVRVTETPKGKPAVTDNYLLERMPSDFGIAFSVRKLTDWHTGVGGDATYAVCLNMPGGGHSCDCKWGSYKAHVKNCRHVDLCLQALRERKF
jgi:hypothetical protein